MPVLVTYASACGSTQEIAERIASRLRSRALDVDCRAIDNTFSVTEYNAVVIGSAVHVQKWLPEASKFLACEAPLLRDRQVWTFSVGMGAAMPSWVQDMATRSEERKLKAKIERQVKPKDHVLFSGVYTERQMPVIIRSIWKCFGGRFGDMREWEKIDTWADGIAGELKGLQSKHESTGSPV